MDLTTAKTIELIKELTRRETPEDLFLYDMWEALNDYFFDGELKPCIIYQAVQPYGKSLSYGFSRKGNPKREIVIQRELDKDLIIYQLIHELCHQWQYENLGVKVDETKPHYDISWCLSINKVLKKLNIDYVAKPYKRTKTYQKENKYLIDDRFDYLPEGKIFKKETLASFPLWYWTPLLKSQIDPIFNIPSPLRHLLN